MTENKTLTTAVEVLNVSPAAQKNEEQNEENGEAAAQPAENKPNEQPAAADLKNYSPFGK